MNKERFEVVQEAMLANQERVVMHSYFYGGDYTSPDRCDLTNPSCKTAGCIAGWTVACFVENPNLYASDAHDKATQILELTADEADALFEPQNWPSGYNSKDFNSIMDYMNQILEDGYVPTGHLDDDR